jgi:hypothetical protein
VPYVGTGTGALAIAVMWTDEGDDTEHQRPSQVMGDVGNGDRGRGVEDASNMRLAIRGFGFGFSLAFAMSLF